MKKSIKVKNLGLIQGSGIGPQLCEIFQNYLQFLDALFNIKTHHIIYDNEKYHSFATLHAAIKKKKKSKKISTDEAIRLKETLSKWHKEENVNIVFRTSINDETLSIFRRMAKEVKECPLQAISGNMVFIFRDMAEGFYSNIDYKIKSDKLIFEGEYSRNHQKKVIKKAINRADKYLGQDYEIWALYKFHLFGESLKNWFHQVAPNTKMYQPDTGMVEFLNNYIFHQNGKKDLLLICSNEVGDLLFEIAVGALNLDPKFDLFTRNILLEKTFKGNLTIYQTIHGSADDIIIEDRLGDIRPDPTLRIAADIAEKALGYKGICKLTEKGLVKAKMEKKLSCDEIVKAVKGVVHNAHLNGELCRISG